MALNSHLRIRREAADQAVALGLPQALQALCARVIVTVRARWACQQSKPQLAPASTVMEMASPAMEIKSATMSQGRFVFAL